jgi:hypothetical protein
MRKHNYPIHRLPFEDRQERDKRIIKLFDLDYAPVEFHSRFNLTIWGVYEVLRKAGRMRVGQKKRMRRRIY